MISKKHKQTYCPYNRDTNDKTRGIKAYHYRKSSNHQEREKEGKEKGTTNHQNTINKMTMLDPYTSITTLYVKGLNFPIIHSVTERIKI